jgi:methylenetetrahydrofolate dehydrogenase (NADP+)/methenyltetrahydrofolate cyclohydrolase
MELQRSVPFAAKEEKMAELLKGIEVVNGMKQQLIDQNNELIAAGIVPCLNIVRIGERADDLSYERGALKRFEGLGIKIQVSVFPESITHEQFEKELKKINQDQNIDCILLFRPMPKHINEDAIMKIFDYEKDMDGMCSENAFKVFAADETGYAPCTPMAVMALLAHYGIELKGKKVTLVGRSMVVGKPLAMLLLKENATVTICHTKTNNLAMECQQADIVIAAAGAAKMIKAEHIKTGTVVIDVGINVDDEGNLCGDVDFDQVEPLASKITPVPGGVGTVTTSILAKHVLKAAQKRKEKIR